MRLRLALSLGFSKAGICLVPTAGFPSEGHERSGYVSSHFFQKTLIPFLTSMIGLHHPLGLVYPFPKGHASSSRSDFSGRK